MEPRQLASTVRKESRHNAIADFKETIFG